MNNNEMKVPNKNRFIDMSPEALDQRLRDLAQLYKLGMALKDARRIGKVEQLRQAEPESSRSSNVLVDGIRETIPDALSQQ
jgi:hypothetical protein